MTLRYSFAGSMRNILFFLLATGLVIGLWSCEFPQTAPNANTLPDTRLANIPPNDTIAQYISLGVRPEVRLYWLGDDPDGYVVAYRYRWTDVYRGQRVVQPYRTILNLVSIGTSNLSRVIMIRGTPRSLPEVYRFLATLTQQDQALVNAINDSLLTGRAFAVPYKTGAVPGDSLVGADSIMHISPTIGQFIFDSPVDSNLHIFEVASIDNSGEVDPTPAIVHFWTLKSPAPIVTVSPPVVNTLISSGLVDTFQIAIREPTDRFRGIRIDFLAIDQSTDERVFQWAVDDTLDPTAWSPWQESTTAYVTAKHFRPIVSGWHRFYVRAKNRWGVLSNIATYNHPTGQGSFKATVVDIDDPNFQRPRVLIINNTQSGNGTRGNPDSNQIKAFYSEVMDSLGLTGRFDILSSSPTSGIIWMRRPEAVIRLGQYSTVMFLMERKIVGLPGVYQLETNGRKNLELYLQAGGNLIFVGPIDTVGPIIIGLGTFFDNIPHMVNLSMSRQRNCVGSKGALGYPDLKLDTSKIQRDSLGAIRFILTGRPRTFGETIGSFMAIEPDSAVWNGRPVNVRYLAPDPVPPARRTYSVVRFGVPLYFCEKNSVIQSLRKALRDVHEIQ